MRYLLFILPLILSSSFSRAAEIPAPVAKARAVVDQALERDYLPTDYVYEATFLYHYYLAAELYAATDIPVYVQYVIAEGTPAKPDLGVKDFYGWTYHAGLLFWPEGSREPWIIDVITGKEPMLRSEWLKKLYAYAPEARPEVSFAEGGNLTFSIFIRENWQGPEKASDLSTTPGIMDAGEMAAICKLVSKTIPYEPGRTEEDREAKLARFRHRTHELLMALEAKGRLESLRFVGEDLYGCAETRD